MTDDKVNVLNVNHPEYRGRVDRAKYEAARTALMQILPKESGLTQIEMIAVVQEVIDPKLFPDGEKAGWWVKTVQLDLEARGKISRVRKSPLRWVRV